MAIKPILTLDKIVLVASVAIMLDVMIRPGLMGNLVLQQVVGDAANYTGHTLQYDLKWLSAELLGVYYLIRRNYVGNAQWILLYHQSLNSYKK